MSTDRATAAVEDQDEFDRRNHILEAANQCFSQLGIQRTSVQDVARMANVSRGTVYRYFEDRGVLVEAAIEFGAQKFYKEVAAAMAKKSTLAESGWRWRRPTRPHCSTIAPEIASWPTTPN